MVKYTIDAVFGSLSDPTRRDILLRLAVRKMTVGEIGQAYGISLPAISKHLKVLEHAKLITRERHGRQQYIQLAPDAFSGAGAYLRNYEILLSNRLDSLEEYLQNKATCATISPDAHIPEPEAEKITVTHVLDFPRQQVWEAYTDPEQIAAWWAPKGATVIACMADVRPDGIWQFTFRSATGQVYTSSGIFKEVVVANKLVYTDGLGDPHAPRPESIVTLAFEDVPGGKTRLTKSLVAAPATHTLQAVMLEAAQRKQ